MADIAFHAERAPSYDRDVTSQYEIYDELVLLPFLDRVLAGGRQLRVLDVGCGTGVISMHLARRGATVEAVDHSPDMLGVARAKAERAGLEQRIRFQVADIRELFYEDASFAGVTCQRVLHHIPDPATVLAEVHRVLAPGGFFYLSDTVADSTPAARVLRRLWGLVLSRSGEEPASQGAKTLPSVQEEHHKAALLECLLASQGFRYELHFLTHAGLTDRLSTAQRARLIKALSFPWRRRQGDVLFALASKPRVP